MRCSSESVVRLTLLACLLAAPALAAPLPAGDDGRLGLGEVLHCYSVARRLPDAPYDPACDDDGDGRVSLGEALLWYAIFTRRAPGILGVSGERFRPGDDIEVTALNVPAEPAELEVELIGEAVTLPVDVLAADGATLHLRMPLEAEVGRWALRLRLNGQPSNRWLLEALPPECAEGFDEVEGACECRLPPTLGIDFGHERLIASRLEGVESMLLFDLDGDGDHDLLAASGEGSSFQSKISWWANQSRGRFGPQQDLADMDARQLLLADMDGDGDSDLVARQTFGVHWLENLAPGQFGPPRQIVERMSQRAHLSVLDLDGDGDADLLYSAPESCCGEFSGLAWQAGDGRGLFGPLLRIGFARDIDAAVALHLDDDDSIDIVYASCDRDEATLHWRPGLGDGEFDDAIDLGAGCHRFLQAADIDADGAPDLVAEIGDQVVWRRNLGAGQLGPPVVLGEFGSVRWVSVQDVDGDEGPDVLVAARSPSSLSWFRNDGGEFEEARVVTDDLAGPESAVVGDVDGEGGPDIVVGTWEEGMHLFVAEGEGYVVAEPVAETGESPHGLALGDVDADGDEDLVVTNWDTAFWYQRHDPDTYGRGRPVMREREQLETWLFEDVTGDGRADFVYGSCDRDEEVEDRLAFYPADAGGFMGGPGGIEARPPGFGARRTITREVGCVRAVAAADLNGNGRMDLAVAYDSTLAWYPSDGEGFFGQRQVVAEDLTIHRLFAVDMNGDRLTDLVGGLADGVRYFAGDGEGGFGAGRGLSGGGPYTLRAVGDLNGNGDPDLLLTARDPERIAWMENSRGRLSFPRTVTGLELFYTAALGDLDHDGDLDVIGSRGGFGDQVLIGWSENDGSGEFGEWHPLRYGISRVLSLLPADFDGDGRIDIGYAALFENEAGWLPGRDGGAFAPSEAALAESAVVALAHGDLNGDSRRDALVATADGALAWSAGDGSGALGPLEVLAENLGRVGAVTAADLDGDGNLEVAALGFDSGDLVIVQRADGGWAPPVTLPGRTTHGSALLGADLDGDEDLDLVLASEREGVSWLENLGPEGWSVPRSIERSPANTRGLLAIDMDGDEDIDLVVAAPEDHRVQWLENEGDGTFPRRLHVGALEGASALAVADVDGDGRLDVLASGLFRGRLVWFPRDDEDGFNDGISLGSGLGDLWSVWAADLDLDGVPEVGSAATNRAEATYNHGLGDGAFGPRRTQASGLTGARVQAADFDGDGVPDLLIGGDAPNAVRVVLTRLLCHLGLDSPAD